MNSLVNTKEAVEKLCAFLTASSSTAAKTDCIENLFSAPVEERSHSVEVEVAFLTAPTAHRVPLYFVLPHEVMCGTICIVTPPPQRAIKNKVLELAEDCDPVAQRVKRVIDTKKLNAKFVDPVTVRAFAKSYDNFIVYGAHKYPAQLSGEFLGHQNCPVWIAKKGPFENSLHKATKTCVVSRRGNNAVTCRVGHTGMTVEQIEENVKALVEKLTKHPQGSSLDKVLHIRVAGTSSAGKRAGLPIYSHTFAFPAAEPPVKKTRKEVTTA